MSAVTAEEVRVNVKSVHMDVVYHFLWRVSLAMRGTKAGIAGIISVTYISSNEAL